MLNVNRFWVVFGLIALIIIESCGRPKKDCSDFKKDYSTMIAGLGNHPDTMVLVKFLDKVIADDTNCLDAYLTRGDLHYYTNNVVKARQDYKRVLNKDVENIYALYALGCLYQDEELYDSSITVFDKAISLKTHGNMVVDFKRINDNLSTEKDRYDIDAVELFYKQAISYYYKRDLEKALSGLSACINNNYKLEMAYFYRGAIEVESNKLSLACEDFGKAKMYGNPDAVSYMNKFCR